jgi:nucleoside-triphosphatase
MDHMFHLVYLFINKKKLLKMSNFVILTGMPGCGKTTMIKKIVDDLKKKNVSNVVGFYTEEVRENEGRIGFDIHLLNGTTGTLARIGYI